MSMMKQIDAVHVAPDELRMLYNALQDFYKLQIYMNEQDSVEGILKLMKVEFQNRNRRSYLMRMLSRYHKLLKDDSIKLLHERCGFGSK